MPVGWCHFKTRAASPIELPMQCRYFTSAHAQRSNGPRPRFLEKEANMPITRPRTCGCAAGAVARCARGARALHTRVGRGGNGPPLALGLPADYTTTTTPMTVNAHTPVVQRSPTCQLARRVRVSVIVVYPTPTQGRGSVYWARPCPSLWQVQGCPPRQGYR